jgi:hypothetical protein
MRWVIDTAPANASPITTVDGELQFSRSKIEENLSNYSAWHYRSQLLSRKHDLASKDLPQGILDEERELVTHATNIDPMDQSAWFYHRWLLGRKEAEPVALRVSRCSVPTAQDSTGIFVAFNQQVQVRVWTARLGSVSPPSSQ